MLSYLNDVKLKKEIVEEMKKHRKNDQIVKGTYGKENGMFKGCAVGCAIHSLNIRKGKDLPYDGHRYFESELGIPEWLARLNDKIFEGLPGGDNTEFAVDFLQAIPVGVDLESIKWKFCSYLLKENIERVLSLKIKDELKEQVVNAIRQVLVVHETAIKTNEWNESAAARSAESAAESARLAESAAWAARSAESAESARLAESAAWAARSAESAARSAESAAESARSAESAYQRYAKELLRLLKEAK